MDKPNAFQQLVDDIENVTWLYAFVLMNVCGKSIVTLAHDKVSN